MTASPSRARRTCGLVYRHAPAVLCGGTALAALVRLTIRDRWPVLSALYYGSPPVVMAVVLLIAAAIWLLRREWRPAIFSGGAAVVAVSWWLATSLFLAPAPEGPPPRGLLRSMGWNLERGKHGWDGIRAGILEVDPDLGWFVEASEPVAPETPWWRHGLEGYDKRAFPGGLFVITKGRIREARTFPLGDEGGRAVEVHVTLRGADITLILADFESSPFRNFRRGSFESLDAAIAGAPPGPLLVGGDFNTPRDSVFVDAWRGPLKHAFESAGRGMDGTWPTPIPFLSIDHCWVNDRIHLRECRLPGTEASDHRPVVVEFTVGE